MPDQTRLMGSGLGGLLLLMALAGSLPALSPSPQDLEETIRIHDNGRNREVNLAGMLDRLAGQDVVFLGETHLDETTHLFEAAVLEGLAARHHDKLVLSLEMFARDEQPALDDFLHGRIDEAAFTKRARPWSNHWTSYRKLLAVAKKRGLPVVAANAPRRLLFKIAMGKKMALDQLKPAERRYLARDFFPGKPEYWKRVDRAVRGHGGGRGPRSPMQRLYDGQNIWDNTMGESVALALKSHPGFAVLHVVGGFHVGYRQGTADQLRIRAPRAKVTVIEVETAFDLLGPQKHPDPAYADFQVRALARARARSSGTDAVEVPRELRFRLVTPPAAFGEKPLPLLVWLHAGGGRAQDAQRYWKLALGREALVASVEGPYQEPDSDLARGEFWSSPGRFREDMGELGYGLDRLVAFLLRHYPVDKKRILVAGEREGGLAVLMAARERRTFAGHYLSLDPRPLALIQREALADEAPETRGVSLLLQKTSSTAARVMEDFKKLGVADREVGLLPSDTVFAMERAVRKGLGLAPLPAPKSGQSLLWLQLPCASFRAHAWGLIQARGFLAAGQAVRLAAPTQSRPAAAAKELVVRPADLMNGKALPEAPADFGGVTILVAPPGAAPGAWTMLEERQVIRKKNPFARLRVAFEHGQPSLARVIEDLKRQGPKAVLVVPGRFCASPTLMWKLRASLPADLSPLELTWLPGLGSSLTFYPESTQQPEEH